MKTKIRVINPLPFDEQDSISWKKITNEGEPLGFKFPRYQIRRQIIEKFISENKDLDIEIHNAVTPKHFTFENGGVFFQGVHFEVEDIQPFYWSNLLSHYGIWNIDEDTLILEDDVVFDRETILNLEKELEYFNQLDLGGKVLNLSRSIPWMREVPDKKFATLRFDERFSYLRDGDLSGTGALYLTKKTKRIILENMGPLTGCDGYFKRLYEKGVIKYFIPNNHELMFRLDEKTVWLGD